jgi:hypothetical protein
MKKPTKAERHQIYKRTLVLYLTQIYWRGLCYHIKNVLPNDVCEMWSPYSYITFYSELLKRKPKDKSIHDYWWDTKDRNIRIKVLEECIEETAPKSKK